MKESTIGYTTQEIMDINNRAVRRAFTIVLGWIDSEKYTMKEIRVMASLFIDEYTPDCTSCEGTGDNFYSCCGDDMRGNDYDICPTCKEHTGWDGTRDDECTECNGTGKEAI
jgi:hypothetical protein